ncbi:uracil phosphoribosyltransferase [Glycomyces buryatensis]|uniref:uracil phosphoribosyltransferase n=1 Tax=Glycomyces buryatensis TaxID=2570927 RepID=A0A4S8QGC1_9ACTN|nr:uracil phosphoribosyltransferase [Glycomyces buryatensis]THV42212.1 uracil phosphoribosyltransferase [Glycomyces buryatensis]
MVTEIAKSTEDVVQLLPQTRRLRALHTIIRDRDADRQDFVGYAGQIIRQLVEAGMELFPFESVDVETPVGQTYRGLRVSPRVCGVSIARAGESMETELSTIAPGVRIGKILIQRDKQTKLPHLYYSALPVDIASRHVLLLDPMLATGGTALAAIEVLVDAGVPEEHIVFVNVLSAPEGIRAVQNRYPHVRMVTSSIENGLNENAYMQPGIGDFGDRYFGTDATPDDHPPV